MNHVSYSFGIFIHRDWMDASSTLSTLVNILETLNLHQYRIFKLDFCSYNFFILQFSRSGKGGIDVYRFVSKTYLRPECAFCHDPLSQLGRQYIIMHEVDAAYKDRFPTIWHFFKK